MDRRIREQIVRNIKGFDGSVAALGHLIGDLEAIWNVEMWDENSKGRLRHAWEKLEEVYAGAVERQPRTFTENDESYVREMLTVVAESLPPATDDS